MRIIRVTPDGELGRRSWQRQLRHSDSTENSSKTICRNPRFVSAQALMSRDRPEGPWPGRAAAPAQRTEFARTAGARCAHVDVTPAWAPRSNSGEAQATPPTGEALTAATVSGGTSRTAQKRCRVRGVPNRRCFTGHMITCPKCGRPEPAAEFKPDLGTYEYTCLWSEDHDDGKPFVWHDPPRHVEPAVQNG